MNITPSDSFDRMALAASHIFESDSINRHEVAPYLNRSNALLDISEYPTSAYHEYWWQRHRIFKFINIVSSAPHGNCYT
jgi:hypothetical protein